MKKFVEFSREVFPRKIPRTDALKGVTVHAVGTNVSWTSEIEYKLFPKIVFQ